MIQNCGHVRGVSSFIPSADKGIRRQKQRAAAAVYEIAAYIEQSFNLTHLINDDDSMARTRHVIEVINRGAKLLSPL